MNDFCDSHTAISVKNLSFYYGNQVILNHVNFEIAAQNFSVLLGKNGGGKSTLFYLLTGLNTCKQGEILLHGKSLESYKGKERAEVLGFLAQSHHSVFNFKVLDVVMTGRSAFVGLSPKKQDKVLAEEALEILEISHLAYKDYSVLSGGERQLVMIARILTQNPKVILLDEPTNHLDVYYQHFLMEKLKILSQSGYSILTIMHNPNSAFLYADDVLFLHDKKIIQSKNLADASDEAWLAQVYGLEFASFNIAKRPIVLPKSVVTNG